jgi:hypothetical protein
MSLTHFTNKAFIITFEESTGRPGCVRYGIKGIYNNKNLAKIDFDKYVNPKNRNTIFKLQEVTLNDEHVLFNYHY